MADDRITIEITLDDGQVLQGLARIKNASKKAGDDIEKNVGGNLQKKIGLVGKSFKNVGASIAQEFKKIGLTIAAAGTALGTFFFTKRSIEVARQQEDAINNLNTSLKLAGTFSKEASGEIQQFADTIQRTTKVGDETVLGLTALARNFARSNEEAVALTKAAIDLDAATGIGLDSAVKNLGKTFSGLTGELGESLPIIKTLTAEQLKAGEAIKLLQDRFGGAAAAQTKTFSGAIAQLGNNFDNLLKQIGFVVTQSPALIGVINKLSETFSNLSGDLKEIRKEENDPFKRFIVGALNALKVTLKITDVLERTFSITKGLIQTVAAGIQGVLVIVAKVINFLTQQLNKLDDKIAEIAGFETDQANVQGGATFGQAGLISDQQATISQFAQFTEELDQITSAAFGEIADNAANSFTEAFGQTSSERFNKFVEELIVVAETSKEVGDEISNSFNKVAENVKSSTNGIGKALVGGLVKTIAFTAQFIGQSLVRTQGGFKAFFGAVLNIIGDLAIQIGTTLIAIGLGIDALKTALGTLTGGVAIAAGLALVALGGVLKELGAGSALEGAAGGGGPSAESAGFTPEAIEDETDGPAVAQDERQLVVNIQGDVLDNEETGLRIAQIINESIDNQGAQFA